MKVTGNEIDELRVRLATLALMEVGNKMTRQATIQAERALCRLSIQMAHDPITRRKFNDDVLEDLDHMIANCLTAKAKPPRPSKRKRRS